MGKANGSRECAPDDRLRVPTTRAALQGEMVGTAQERLCPPYDRAARHLRWRTEPSWATDATSVPSGLKIRPRVSPRPSCALGESCA